MITSDRYILARESRIKFSLWNLESLLKYVKGKCSMQRIDTEPRSLEEISQELPTTLCGREKKTSYVLIYRKIEKVLSEIVRTYRSTCSKSCQVFEQTEPELSNITQILPHGRISRVAC